MASGGESKVRGIAPFAGNNARLALIALAEVCEEAGNCPTTKSYFEMRDFRDLADRLRAIAEHVEAEKEKTRVLLRRVVGVLRDVERAGVPSALREIDAEMDHA